MSELRVLVVGGYGTFGGRIVALLEEEPRLTLIVAGRSLPRAQHFVAARNPQARLEAAAFDRSANVAAQLAALAPAVVVDASGPFQAYGYGLIEACIAARVHYLDLADGSDFVAGVGTLDARAREAGVFCLAGASSFPTLTAAVVRRLAQDLEHVDTIRAGLAPLPYGGVGENVIRALAGYAGKPVRVRRGGVATEAIALAEQMRFTIAPLGRVPLANRLFSLVDVPDLRVLPELWPEVESVWVGAGPVPEIFHRALIVCAHLVRLRLVRSLSPLAPLMHLMSNALGWGERRGGMFVAVRGRTAVGRTVERTWHLLAEGGDGPMIPAMAVEAVIRALLDGRAPPPGARAAATDLGLADYEPLFARRKIYTGTRDEAAAEPLYARLLGSAWRALPAEIREMHDLNSALTARGSATVERGAGFLARLVARAIGFPASADEIPVMVRLTSTDGIETWTRSFGEETFSSAQFAGQGRDTYLLCERFGWLTFAMALVVESGRLTLVPRRWSVLGIPLPMWLCPRADAHESVEAGRFRFHVEIRHPWTGLIVRYRGALSRPEPI